MYLQAAFGLVCATLFVQLSMSSGDETLGLGVNNIGPNHQYSESRSRRAIVPPTNACYTKFFVSQNPPTGFRPLSNQNIKHICQQLADFNDETYYATMFDQHIGIAVYSAYRLNHDEVPLIGTFPRVSKWIQDPDISNTRQGSNPMYHGNSQNIHKGHLVPAETYSFDCIAMVSTFRFTNAVPQYAAFNTGPWNQYEKKVRTFASNMCRSNHDGDLYLLTGFSEAKLVRRTWQKHSLTYFPVNNPNTGTNIVIPNSMWTAGCCINRFGVVGGFAAIGNNVQVNPQMHQVTVQRLQHILATGIGGGATINLFPGDAGCSDPSKQRAL